MPMGVNLGSALVPSKLTATMSTTSRPITTASTAKMRTMGVGFMLLSAFQSQRQTGRHQRDALTSLRHLLIEQAQRIDKRAHLAPQRNNPQTDFVAHQNNRPGGTLNHS